MIYLYSIFIPIIKRKDGRCHSGQQFNEKDFDCIIRCE